MGFGGHVTSYDYDAPISEQGYATRKYHIFRDEIMKYASWQVPEIPESIPMIEIYPKKIQVVGSLFHSLNFSSPDLKADQFYPF